MNCWLYKLEKTSVIFMKKIRPWTSNLYENLVWICSCVSSFINMLHLGFVHLFFEEFPACLRDTAIATSERVRNSANYFFDANFLHGESVSISSWNSGRNTEPPFPWRFLWCTDKLAVRVIRSDMWLGFDIFRNVLLRIE